MLLKKKTAVDFWQRLAQYREKARMLGHGRTSRLATSFSIPTYGNVLAAGLCHPNAIDLSELETVEPLAFHGYGAANGIDHSRSCPRKSDSGRK
ncbi:hypothetical protein X744_29365 [Mesorhizobium sp. LNJC372A00]|nr:hypothetical protein X745_28900 [Mesorhizobium sp. LNJC374B00]ESY52219.1 hypothetical protein X744_29365 [Mesorhizobium sp. LNJC372A00]